MDTNISSIYFWHIQFQKTASMVLWLAWLHRGQFKSRSGQTNDYEIGICCLSTKHSTLMSESKNWLAWNHDSVSEWGNMSSHAMLFQ